MLRRYVLFANFVPLTIMLGLIVLFVPYGERAFLVFTALAASALFGAIVGAVSLFSTVPVVVARLFDREGAKTDFGRKTCIDPRAAENPDEKPR